MLPSFLSICGPPRYSEIRLNLAQGIQGVGSFVAPLLASRVFFASTVDNAQGLKNVQWTYLGVACFVALLIILFFLVPMPEVTDADMGLQESEISMVDVGPLSKQYNLFLGVWSQFCYVGAQGMTRPTVVSSKIDTDIPLQLLWPTISSTFARKQDIIQQHLVRGIQMSELTVD